MTRVEKDNEREERIKTRIIVDTYSPEEQAWGWSAYLGDTMDFPFEARCVTEREESPLEEGETIRVVGMSPTDPTLSQMFVTIEPSPSADVYRDAPQRNPKNPPY